jgi:hypothetical protein
MNLQEGAYLDGVRMGDIGEMLASSMYVEVLKGIKCVMASLI